MGASRQLELVHLDRKVGRWTPPEYLFTWRVHAPSLSIATNLGRRTDKIIAPPDASFCKQLTWRWGQFRGLPVTRFRSNFLAERKGGPLHLQRASSSLRWTDIAQGGQRERIEDGAACGVIWGSAGRRGFPCATRVFPGHGGFEHPRVGPRAGRRVPPSHQRGVHNMSLPAGRDWPPDQTAGWEGKLWLGTEKPLGGRLGRASHLWRWHLLLLPRPSRQD